MWKLCTIVKIANFFLLISIVFANALAAINDNQQAIEVEADSLEIRDSENISIYRGNVLLTQGSLTIRCNQLTIYFDDQNALSRMEMIGSPASYEKLDERGQQFLGQANQMEYRQKNSTLILRDNAQFSHAGDIIKSNSITVNTENNSIQAGSVEPDDRVHVLIQPKQP